MGIAREALVQAKAVANALGARKRMNHKLLRNCTFLFFNISALATF